MPGDVPALAEMYRRKLLEVDPVDGACFLRVCDVVVELEHGGEVHEVAGIDCDVGSIFKISALFSSAMRTLVLDIINHQAAIVYNLSHTAGEINILIRLKVLNVLSAEAFRHDKSKDWSPALTASVKQIVDGLFNRTVDSLDIGKHLWSVSSYFTATRTFLQQAWITL